MTRKVTFSDKRERDTCVATLIEINDESKLEKHSDEFSGNAKPGQVSETFHVFSCKMF